MIPGVLVAAAATVILAMTFAGAATGQSSTTTWITVAGAGFTPNGNACDYSRHGYSGEIEDQSGCDLAGGIQLPDGSTVTGVFVFYDSHGTGERGFHLEESLWTGDGEHVDIASLDLPTCSPPDFAHPCVAFQLSGFESPNIMNPFFGYAGWLSGGEAGFTLIRLLVRVSVPTGGGGANVNPLSPPVKPPTVSTNPH
jgi:hypothetical protein